MEVISTFATDSIGFDPEKIYDIIVLGGGPAAIGCAIYAARFAMDVLVVGKIYGGLIATTHVVENYPAVKSVSGQGNLNITIPYTGTYWVRLRAWRQTTQGLVDLELISAQ